MATENISQEFSLKKIDKTKNYFIEEGNQYELKSKNHKNFTHSPPPQNENPKF